MVANGGYLGPPDADDAVENGYSVASDGRGRGLVSAITRALVAHARQSGRVSRVFAHTRPDNLASMAVLRKSGLREVTSDQPGTRRFERLVHEQD